MIVWKEIQRGFNYFHNWPELQKLVSLLKSLCLCGKNSKINRAQKPCMTGFSQKNKDKEAWSMSEYQVTSEEKYFNNFGMQIMILLNFQKSNAKF